MQKFKPYLPMVALVLAIIGFVFHLNRSGKELAAAKAATEAAELALKNQIVSTQESKKQMASSVEDLTRQNALLSEAVAEARAAAPTAKPESAAKLRTLPVKVVEAPRQPEPEGPAALPPCPTNKYAPDGTGSFYCVEENKPLPPKCVLSAGDQGTFAVDEVVLKTDLSNRIITGTAAFWREVPGPRAKLAEGKFSSALSDVSTLALPEPPRWGAEVVGQCHAAGCGYGAGVLLPPVRFLGLRWEGRADAFLAPVPGVLGALGARW